MTGKESCCCLKKLHFSKPQDEEKGGIKGRLMTDWFNLWIIMRWIHCRAGN